MTKIVVPEELPQTRVVIDLAGAMDKITPEMIEISTRHMTDVYINRCNILANFVEVEFGCDLTGVSNDDLHGYLVDLI